MPYFITIYIIYISINVYSYICNIVYHSSFHYFLLSVSHISLVWMSTFNIFCKIYKIFCIAVKVIVLCFHKISKHISPCWASIYSEKMGKNKRPHWFYCKTYLDFLCPICFRPKTNISSNDLDISLTNKA